MKSSFFNKIFHKERGGNDFSLRLFSVIPLIFVLYAIYYDLTFLKYKPDALWYTAKVFFIFMPVILAFNNSIKRENRLFLMSFNWILYSFYHTYFVSLSYNVTFIQVCVAFSVMVVFTRLRYTIFASSLFAVSFFSIISAKHEMAYVANGYTAKPEVLINSICFQGLCYMVYYFVTLPKLKQMENDKKFADYGKTSSFLMHEMAKPLRKMNQNPECFQEELNRLNEIYSIASSLRNKENPQLVLEEVNVDKFVNEIINKYESFITAFNIKMSIQTDVHNIFTDKKLIQFSLDNLIRNAIEANVDFEGDRFIEIKISENKILIRNPFFDTSFSENNLFKPMSSTKKGHMGVGLYISKMISDTLGHKLHINASKNFFEVLISLS